jgi:hypothetical protein
LLDNLLGQGVLGLLAHGEVARVVLVCNLKMLACLLARGPSVGLLADWLVLFLLGFFSFFFFLFLSAVCFRFFLARGVEPLKINYQSAVVLFILGFFCCNPVWKLWFQNPARERGDKKEMRLSSRLQNTRTTKRKDQKHTPDTQYFFTRYARPI